MSKKPPKKSDLNKAWMRAGKEKIIRFAPEYHLIVSEGTQTEPLYFGEIKKIINSKYRERIVLEVTGVGDNTENLFIKAQNLAQRHGTTPYRHVWLVFDKDDFPNEHFDQTSALCETSSSSETTWHTLIWSIYTSDPQFRVRANVEDGDEGTPRCLRRRPESIASF